MLTRDEQRVVRAWGGWALIELWVNPESPVGWPYVGGSSHPRGFEDGCWLDYDGKGVRITNRGHEVVSSVKWAAIKAHGHALSADLRARLADWQQRSRQHQRDYPVFAAEGDAIGCGRAPYMCPLTREQALYADQYDAYHRERLRPWHEVNRALREEQDALLDEALPLHDAEPELTFF